MNWDEVDIEKYAATKRYFLDKMRKVDSFCDVQFEIEVPYAIRIRPSHPRYRATLREQADFYRPIGLLVSIVKEVDDWGDPAKREPWWKRLLRRIFDL